MQLGTHLHIVACHEHHVVGGAVRAAIRRLLFPNGPVPGALNCALCVSVRLPIFAQGASRVPCAQFWSVTSETAAFHCPLLGEEAHRQ